MMLIISINYMSQSINKMQGGQNKQADQSQNIVLQQFDDDKVREEQAQMSKQLVGVSDHGYQNGFNKEKKQANDKQNNKEQGEKREQTCKEEQFMQDDNTKSEEILKQEQIAKVQGNFKQKQFLKSEGDSQQEQITKVEEINQNINGQKISLQDQIPSVNDRRQLLIHQCECSKQNKSCWIQQKQQLKKVQQKLLKCQKEISDLSSQLQSQRKLNVKNREQISLLSKTYQNLEAQLKQAPSKQMLTNLRSQVARNESNSQIFRKKNIKLNNDLNQKIEQNESLKKQIKTQGEISKIIMDYKNMFEDWMKKCEGDKNHQQLLKIQVQLAQSNHKSQSLSQQLQNMKKKLKQKQEEYKISMLDKQKQINKFSSLVQKSEKKVKASIDGFSIIYSQNILQFQQKKKQYEEQIVFLQESEKNSIDTLFSNQAKLNQNNLSIDCLIKKNDQNQKDIIELKKTVQKLISQNQAKATQFSIDMSKNKTEVASIKQNMESQIRQFKQQAAKMYQQSKRQQEQKLNNQKQVYEQKINLFETLFQTQKISYEGKLINIKNEYQSKLQELQNKIDQYKQQEAFVSNQKMEIQQDYDKKIGQIKQLKAEIGNLSKVNNKYSSFIEIFKDESPIDQQFLQKIDDQNRDHIFDHISIKINNLVTQLQNTAQSQKQLVCLLNQKDEQLKNIDEQKQRYELQARKLIHEQELKLKTQNENIVKLKGQKQLLTLKIQQLEVKLKTIIKQLEDKQKVIEKSHANEQKYLKQQVQKDKQINQMKLSLSKYLKEIQTLKLTIQSKQEQPIIRPSPKQPQVDISAYEQQISALTQQVAGAQIEKQALLTKMKVLQAENRTISQLKENISGLQSQIRLLQKEKKQLEKQIADLQANAYSESFGISDSYEDLYAAVKEQKQMIEKDLEMLEKKYKILLAQKENTTVLKRKASFSSLSFNSHFTMKSNIMRDEKSKEYIVKSIPFFTNKQVKYIDLIFKMDEMNKNNFGYIFNDLDLQSTSIIAIIRRKNHIVAFLTLPKQIATPCTILISVTQEKNFRPLENLKNDILPYKYEYTSLCLGGQQIKIKSGSKQLIFNNTSFRKYFQNYSKTQIFGEEFGEVLECDQFEIHKVTLE